MKKSIAILAILFCVAGTASSAFARGHGHGGRYHGGYHHRSHGGGYHHGGRHYDDRGIAFGIAGGLLLGSVLINTLEPPPPRVVYVPTSPAYPPSRTCVEERTITGEWQINRYNGHRGWLQYQNPVVRRYEVPCY